MTISIALPVETVMNETMASIESMTPAQRDRLLECLSVLLDGIKKMRVPSAQEKSDGK